MADSVTGVPVFVLADLIKITAGASAVGQVVDNDNTTITTPGTNASLVSQTALATTVVTSGSATGIVVLCDVGVSGEVTRATISGNGLVAADTVTISGIGGDAMDTNCVLTVGAAISVVRSRWNSVAVVAVSDHPADNGDGNARAYFVQKSLNSIWRLGGATLGTATGSDYVVPVA